MIPKGSADSVKAVLQNTFDTLYEDLPLDVILNRKKHQEGPTTFKIKSGSAYERLTELLQH